VISLLLAVLAAMSVIMLAGWSFQRAANNGGWTDVFWTYGTGATIALAALVPFGGRSGPDARQVLVAALVGLWALRLGTYVARRVAGGPEDSRYAGLRADWGQAFQRRMFLLLIVQAPATALLGVSVLLAARASETPFGPPLGPPDGPALGLRDVIGAAVLLGAIHGQVCDTGLWAWSRHPNYLFEALGWIAYPVIALQPAVAWTWAAWVAPVVMFLILRYGTGVPPLEAAQLRSKGEAYRRYQARVSPFLPRPPKNITP
jgi:steroid 5-alpha reductase family enzyme